MLYLTAVMFFILFKGLLLCHDEPCFFPTARLGSTSRHGAPTGEGLQKVGHGADLLNGAV